MNPCGTGKKSIVILTEATRYTLHAFIVRNNRAARRLAQALVLVNADQGH